jgi:hypothetical protein
MWFANVIIMWLNPYQILLKSILGSISVTAQSNGISNARKYIYTIDLITFFSWITFVLEVKSVHGVIGVKLIIVQ